MSEEDTNAKAAVAAAVLEKFKAFQNRPEAVTKDELESLGLRSWYRLR